MTLHDSSRGLITVFTSKNGSVESIHWWCISICEWRFIYKLMSSFCILLRMLNRSSCFFHVSTFSRLLTKKLPSFIKYSEVKLRSEENCHWKEKSCWQSEAWKDEHTDECVQLRSFVVSLFIDRWGFTLSGSLWMWGFTRKSQMIASILNSISFGFLHHSDVLWGPVLVSMQILEMRKTHRKLISMHLCLLSWTRNTEENELPRQIELVEMYYMMHDGKKSFSCIHFFSSPSSAARSRSSHCYSSLLFIVIILFLRHMVSKKWVCFGSNYRWLACFPLSLTHFLWCERIQWSKKTRSEWTLFFLFFYCRVRSNVCSSLLRDHIIKISSIYTINSSKEQRHCGIDREQQIVESSTMDSWHDYRFGAVLINSNLLDVRLTLRE